MADAMKLRAGERAFTAWAASSRADATPLMWTWQEMPQSQRDRWEAIALAASPPAREEAPAEGAGEIDRAVKRMRDQLVGSATFTSLTFGREDVRLVLDTLDALRNRTSEPEAGEASQNDYSPRKTLTDPAPATATADKLRVAVEALERIKDLGSDGEHSGDRHARCRDFARQALAALNEQPQ